MKPYTYQLPKQDQTWRKNTTNIKDYYIIIVPVIFIATMYVASLFADIEARVYLSTF